MITTKRGDQTEIALIANADLSAAPLRLLVEDREGVLVVDRVLPVGAAVWDAQSGTSTITAVLSPAETATPGLHRVEVEGPGPRTWPSDGYVHLLVRGDLG